MIVMLFADKIRRIRDEIRMLQWQFATTMDIDAPLFSKIERGKCHTQHEQVIAIAKIFKVSKRWKRIVRESVECCTKTGEKIIWK
jgi:predicted transcriptional regulator